MEYPSKDSDRRYVIQHHWRGKSVHKDFRMEVDDHLNGWTILDNPSGTPEVQTIPEAEKAYKDLSWALNPKNPNRGLRAETKCYSEVCNEWEYDIEETVDGFISKKKTNIDNLSDVEFLEELARQPKVWLKVHGVVKPGEVGATAGEVGVLHIVDTGHYWEGTQKPYFHEYFLKSDKTTGVFPSGRYTRIIFRGVRVQRINPDTKKPIKGQFEMMWRTMIPGDQNAYAMKRGIKKGWKPPKGVIPIPPDQRKGELWDKWQAYMKGEEKSKEEDSRVLEQLPFAGYKNFKECVDTIMEKKQWDKERASAYCAVIARKTGEILVKARFVLQLNSWEGPFHVRGIPDMEWYLRVDDGHGTRSWLIPEGDPTREIPQMMSYEGKVSSKWMTFDGVIKPGHPYNPNKELPATMSIVDSGSVDWTSNSENGLETIEANFHGKKLSGKWSIVQEEKGSDTFTLDRLTSEELYKMEWVLHRHYWDTKSHFDLRWKISEDHKKEFNLYGDPRQMVKGESEIKAVFKDIHETPSELKEWMVTEGKGLTRMVGPLETKIDVEDHGEGNIIDETPVFISMMLHGKDMKGYYTARKGEAGWFFSQSKLPEPHSSGDPESGDYYKPFIKEQKKGWDYYWLRIYDMRQFSRCITDYKQYLPDLNLSSGVQDVLVCLYPRPGTTHGARVAAIKVSADTPESEAISWIKSNKLHTFSSALIRGESSLSALKSENDEEVILKIIDEELKKRSKTDEERTLDITLKKRKLELMNRWLDSNKGEKE
jgi:hypothetical protein